MSDYLQGLFAHLGQYKVDRLGVAEHGTFAYRGKDLTYSHILPREHQWLNILEPFRQEIRSYIEDQPGIKLHKYFHRLNSSQAFAFNLFYPFFEFGASANLLRAFDIHGDVAWWRPEWVADSIEGTNVDIAWKSSDDAWTYCEVKLSEQGFGTAQNDPRHCEKLEKIYAPILRPYIDPDFLTESQFFSKYQILRNVWLAARDPDASLVFLMPKGNTALWAPLREVLSALRPTLSSRIHLVEIESVLARLAADSHIPDRLAGYADLLVEKYIPSEDVPALASAKTFEPSDTKSGDGRAVN